MKKVGKSVEPLHNSWLAGWLACDDA